MAAICNLRYSRHEHLVVGRPVHRQFLAVQPGRQKLESVPTWQMQSGIGFVVGQCSSQCGYRPSDSAPASAIDMEAIAEQGQEARVDFRLPFGLQVSDLLQPVHLYQADKDHSTIVISIGRVVSSIKLGSKLDEDLTCKFSPILQIEEDCADSAFLQTQAFLSSTGLPPRFL